MNFWENGGGDRGNARQGDFESAVKSKLNEYGNKSEEQLMNELLSSVRKMKADGTFDPSALENLFNTAYLFLNDAQRERMRAIIDMLKQS